MDDRFNGMAFIPGPTWFLLTVISRFNWLLARDFAALFLNKMLIAFVSDTVVIFETLFLNEIANTVFLRPVLGL